MERKPGDNHMLIERTAPRSRLRSLLFASAFMILVFSEGRVIRGRRRLPVLYPITTLIPRPRPRAVPACLVSVRRDIRVRNPAV